MSWRDLAAEVASEFEPLLGYGRLDDALERAVARRCEWTREYQRERLRAMLPEQRRRRYKRNALCALRRRLRNRAVIRCANERCAVEFIPYRSSTLYCSKLCCKTRSRLGSRERQRERRHAMSPEQRRRRYKQNSLCALRRRLRNRAAVRCADERCAVEFVPYRAQTKFCSTRCCRNAWQRKHPGKRIAYQRAQRRRVAELRLRNRAAQRCRNAQCTATFVSLRPNRLYCSRLCAQRDVKHRWQSRVPARVRRSRQRHQLVLMRRRLRERAAIRCKNDQCAVEFVPYRANTLYCSKQCRSVRRWRRHGEAQRAYHRAYWRRKSLEERRQINQKYVLRRRERRLRERVAIRCKNERCAVEFVPQHKLALYCSRACRVRWAAITKTRRLTAAQREHRRAYGRARYAAHRTDECRRQTKRYRQHTGAQRARHRDNCRRLSAAYRARKRAAELTGGTHA